jgi:hypothetical protein
MAVFTVHLPPGEARLDRAVLVPDRFAWAAAAFSGLWFLYHRLWLGFLAVALVSLALWLLTTWAGFSSGASMLAQMVFALIIGLEANSVRRWKFSRRGWRMVDVVTGRDAEDAERRFLDRATAGTAAAPAPPRAAVPAVRAGQGQGMPADEVVGLFPTPGGVR